MKIISGTYKGRNLKGYDLSGTRPTMDRVRESLFAMLQDYVKGSVCLDLFAGSGALGLEALSEGATSCVFVDRNKKAIKAIEENVENLGIEEETVIIKEDFERALKKFQDPFDLIFLDPPYQTNAIERSLREIKKNNLLRDHGIIVLESDSLEKFIYDDTYYEKIKERAYGDKYIWVIKKKENSSHS